MTLGRILPARSVQPLLAAIFALLTGSEAVGRSR